MNAVTEVANAPDNPEFAWVDESSGRVEFAICDQLDSIVTGNKLDEIHEQLSDIFAEPLPVFQFDRFKNSSQDYFKWLDEVLNERGYTVVSIDPSLNDELWLLPIDKTNCDRLSEIAASLH
jgi:hypothetical protein